MKKKALSLMLAGMLCMGMSLTAFAAETAPGSTDVTTEGTVNYADTTVYSVTLPTSSCFNFVVDPQGILSSVDSATYTEEFYPEGTAGHIIATEGTGAYINNKSSVPIKLMVEAYVEKDDSTGDASSVNLLADAQANEVNSGIDNNMWLTFDITNDDLDVTTFEDETKITRDTVNANVIAITQNGKPATGEKGTQISFALNQAAYQFTGSAGNYTYEMKADEKGDSVGMRLSGRANTNADWSVYTGSTPEKIIVKTIFDFDKLSTDYSAAALDGRAHGVLEDAAAEYFAGMGYDENDEPTGVPAEGAMDYVVGSGVALQIPFSFGTGVNELKIKSITVNGAEIASADYKVINSEICFKSTEENVKAAMEAATPEGVAVPVVITTSDDQETTVNVTMYK